jgi:hypothetical protein
MPRGLINSGLDVFISFEVTITLPYDKPLRTKGELIFRDGSQYFTLRDHDIKNKGSIILSAPYRRRGVLSPDVRCYKDIS